MGGAVEPNTLLNSHEVETQEQLVEAAREGRADAMRVLVELGADVSAQMQDGHTLLHLAAEMGHGEVVRALVELGADVRAQTRDGATARTSQFGCTVELYSDSLLQV